MHLHHLFESWDAKAKRFCNEFGGNLEGASIVEPYLKARAVRRLLDIGCGHGRYVPVYEAAGVIEVIGVDVSKWNVEMAQKKFPHLVFRCLNISDLDYEPDYFDAGVSANCLSYVPPRRIGRTLERLSTQCRSLLLIEQTRGKATLGRHVHDYSGLSERMQKTEHYRFNELHDVMVWDRTDALQQ